MGIEREREDTTDSTANPSKRQKKDDGDRERANGSTTTTTARSNLIPLIYDDSGDKPKLSVLDQLLIPAEKKFIDILDVSGAWAVIRNMNIRGAPLIAIVACLGLAVDLKSDRTSQELDKIQDLNGKNHFDAIYAHIESKMNYLLTSRPTAVNLSNAMEEMKHEILSLKNNENESTVSDRERIVSTVLRYARFMLDRDREDNVNLANFGADHILAKKPPGAKVAVVTICNTGALATSFYGTALGVVRAIHEREQLKKIVALETRPYNQGSRLTAFEIVEEKMPGGTLICDSMAAYLMDKEKVDVVIIGADRVCANGDTANKVGSYSLALAAAAHQVPFYVACPCTTLDINMPKGSDIHIEERPAEELLASSRAPPSIAVWNPSFDVTPAKYISGIITEKGLIHPAANGTIDVAAFVEKHSAKNGGVDQNGEATKPPVRLWVPIDYFEQSIKTLPNFLYQNADKVMEVLGATLSQDLECTELGAGEVNHVFSVHNKLMPEKRVIVKQALPYLRSAGESWPLPTERAFYEYKALSTHREMCPDFVPKVYYFSRPSMLIVMECLNSTNILLRTGMNMGVRYPRMASDVGKFCARCLFSSSGFAMSAKALREQMELWSQNREMCELTETLVFADPYVENPQNRWTSPELDDWKKAIEKDEELKVIASKYQSKFVSSAQALIHGDLHTGSIMCSCTEGETHVIHQEFACYGPMGFDIGVFVAHLLLAYVSQPGHVHKHGDKYATWILEQISVFWDSFTTNFVEMWNDPKHHTGYLYGRELISVDAIVKSSQVDWVKEILCDTIVFAGMEMLRRIVGVAHVEDLEAIGDPVVRAQCERHGLRIAMRFMKTANSIATINEAIQICQELKNE